MADGEPGAEVYSAAADRDQASIVYREAVSFVNASPHLKKRLWPVPSKKELTYPRGNSFYRVLSSEAHTKEGFNIHGLIFDEFHAQPSPELYDTLKYGGAARRQPLFIYITTAGYDRESVCYKKHLYARDVLAGAVYDPEFFAYIAEAQEEDDWQSEEVWRRVNPSYGITINPDEFKRQAKVAAETPSEENTFKRYRLNIWTQQQVKWLGTDVWDACKRDRPDLAGEPCYGGLDLCRDARHQLVLAVLP
jgi:phage terminase large subunit-like protein